MITYSTWSPETPAFSRAPLMATPPRSAADWSFRPPSRRPIGVRAPATITDPPVLADMGVPPLARSKSIWCALPDDTHHPDEGRGRPRDRRVTPGRVRSSHASPVLGRGRISRFAPVRSGCLLRFTVPDGAGPFPGGRSEDRCPMTHFNRLRLRVAAVALGLTGVAVSAPAQATSYDLAGLWP